jgi:Flp pilus assembly protein TadD
VHYNLALCLAGQPGRQEEAVSHAAEALRLKPDYLEAHNALAIMYAQQNRFDLARHQWEQALQVDPNYEIARQNLRRLEQMVNAPDRSRPPGPP